MHPNYVFSHFLFFFLLKEDFGKGNYIDCIYLHVLISMPG